MSGFKLLLNFCQVFLFGCCRSYARKDLINLITSRILSITIKTKPVTMQPTTSLTPDTQRLWKVGLYCKFQNHNFLHRLSCTCNLLILIPRQTGRHLRDMNKKKHGKGSDADFICVIIPLSAGICIRFLNITSSFICCTRLWNPNGYGTAVVLNYMRSFTN